jgi:hypothetical protein
MNISLFVEPGANKLQLSHGAALTKIYSLEDLIFYIP